MSGNRSGSVTVTDEALAAALIALAAYNIPTDVQELLVRGDPMRGIPPRALAGAIVAGALALDATFPDNDPAW